MEIDVMLQGFDANGAYQGLRDALTQFVESWSDTIAQTADVNIRYYPDLRGAITHEVAVLVDSVCGDIFPTGDNAWQAWLEEYGKGSEMESPASNPYLLSYIGSNLWNDLREAYEIAGRPKGAYMGIDHQMHESSGRLAGLNLEELSQESWFVEWMARKGFTSNPFLPTPPTHFLSEALESNHDAIIHDLQQLLSDFNWVAYFIMG